jgi:hypothetical protein
MEASPDLHRIEPQRRARQWVAVGVAATAAVVAAAVPTSTCAGRAPRSVRERPRSFSIASVQSTVRASRFPCSHARSRLNIRPAPRLARALLAERKSGVRGFAGCAPNKQGIVPPLSDDFFAKIQLGPAALAAPAASDGGDGKGNTDKFYQNQYKCAACGTTVSGHISFVEHCRGKAHIRSAGHAGFAGLLPNDAGIIPPLPPQIAAQIGAQPGPQENAAIVGRPPPPSLPDAAPATTTADGGGDVPAFAQAAAAAAAAMKAAAAAPAAAKAHAVRMNHASLAVLANAARAHDAANPTRSGRSSAKEAVARAQQSRQGRPQPGRAGPVPMIEGGGPLAIDRSRLPIASFKDEVLNTVRNAQVTVLQGDTGCGKTTQARSPPFPAPNAMRIVT